MMNKGEQRMLDMVHDIQTAYRKLVDSMSRPGKLADLSEEASKLAAGSVMLGATQIVAHMLLDTEVTFKVVSAREQEAASMIGQMTYAKEASLEAADYIFVLQDAPPGAWQMAIARAKHGELGDPHQSATIIFEQESLNGSASLRLTGPGIQHATSLRLSMEEDWIDLRAERNSEFPLGIDMLFTDRCHRILALPRTTQLVHEEG